MDSTPDPANADDELLARARAGDAAAIEHFLVAHLPSLRAYVRVHLSPEMRQRESCSDIVSSVCREILAAGEGFEYRGSEAFRAWLQVWVKHKILDRIRYWNAGKRQFGRELPMPTADDLGDLALAGQAFASPVSEAMRKEDLRRLEQALGRLSEEHREVLALCQIAGLPRDEVGRRMGGRSAGAIRSLLNRAKVALSAELERSVDPDWSGR